MGFITKYTGNTAKPGQKPAILVESAECRGSGSDTYKWVNGITKSVRAKCREINPDAEILVPSHTLYQNEPYKKVVFYQDRANHRQINCRNYYIVAIINA